MRTPNDIKITEVNTWARIGANLGRHCTIISHMNPSPRDAIKVKKIVHLTWVYYKGADISGFYKYSARLSSLSGMQ